MMLRVIAGGLIVAAGLVLAGRRLAWLAGLVRAGQPDPGRGGAPAARIRAWLADVLGQRKLFQRMRSGLPHALVFWGFAVLLLTVAEALGDTFVSRGYALPLIGRAAWVGFTEDLFTVAVLAGLVVLAGIRLAESPSRHGRGSRFYGSHAGAAWVTLALIALVLITLLGYRAAQVNAGEFPYGRAAFATHWLAAALAPLGAGNASLATGLLLANIAVLTGFGVFLTYSKHLHIVTAPLNVAFARRPRALGELAVPVLASPPPEGQLAALTWKQRLDTLTCTECGRCQADSERDDGNDVRRVGEEGLFQVLAAENLKAFGGAEFTEIFTTDPHSFNTLRNEYSELGLTQPVWHYSQLLERLVADGSIPVRPLGLRVTYHDPCYLARHNRLTRPLRRLLRALGCELAEMPRHGTSTYCCGAGGGRIWMADTAPGQRPSESRIAEAIAIAVGAGHLAVACPRDFVMYTEAVKTTGNEGQIEVADLIGLVDRAREVSS